MAKRKLTQEEKETVDNIMSKYDDKIDSPSHYKLDGIDIETIEIIKAICNQYNGFSAKCIGDVLKYLIRAQKKNGLEDLKKARKYLDWLILELENE